MKKLITIIILFVSICINSFSAEAIYIKSSYQSNKTDTDIRILAENLAFLKILNSEKNSNEKDFIQTKINNAISIINNYQNKINDNNLSSVKKHLNNDDALIVEYIKANKNNLVTNIDKLTLSDNIANFYKEFLAELTRLYKLKNKYPSEIAKIDDNELLGIEMNKHNVYLTFDDGPSKYTGGKIDILNKYNISADFFVVGKNVDLYKDEFTKLVNSNNLIGYHSDSHSNLIKLDKEKQYEEIVSSKKLIEKNYGIKIEYFRAPYGSRNDISTELIASAYKKHILWNIDSQDWQKDFTEDIMYERVVRLVHLYDGGIVLFHDNNSKTQDVLEKVIISLQNSGFNFKSEY